MLNLRCGNSQWNGHKERDTYVPVDNEIFDTVEGMAIGIRRNSRGHGEYRRLLEAGDEHP